MPALIFPGIRWRLTCFAQDGDEGLVFTSPRGLPLRHMFYVHGSDKRQQAIADTSTS